MSGKPKALLTGMKGILPYVYPESLIEEIGKEVDWVLPVEQTAIIKGQRDKRLQGEISATEFIFSTWGMPKLDAELLDRLPNLKAVFYAAGSVKIFVTEESWKRGIRIFSAARINAVPVAEFTVARIILGLKHVEQLRVQAFTDWDRSNEVRQRMQGNFRSRVGLISFGSIARLVRERLSTYDHEVLVYDPFLSEAEAAKVGVRLVGLDELFRECHAISLHTPLLKETIGMIRGEHFASMREGAVFVNTSRGAIIRQGEMGQALANRPDVTVYLDVVEPEPPTKDDLLFELPNVHVTPHIAGSMGYECERMAVAVLDAFRTDQAGGTSELEVTEADMGRIA